MYLCKRESSALHYAFEEPRNLDELEGSLLDPRIFLSRTAEQSFEQSSNQEESMMESCENLETNNIRTHAAMVPNHDDSGTDTDFTYIAEHAISTRSKAQVGSNVGRMLALEERERIQAGNRLAKSNPYHQKLRIDAAKQVARQREREAQRRYYNMSSCNNRQLMRFTRSYNKSTNMS